MTFTYNAKLMMDHAILSGIGMPANLFIPNSANNLLSSVWLCGIFHLEWSVSIKFRKPNIQVDTQMVFLRLFLSFHLSTEDIKSNELSLETSLGKQLDDLFPSPSPTRKFIEESICEETTPLTQSTDMCRYNVTIKKQKLSRRWSRAEFQCESSNIQRELSASIFSPGNSNAVTEFPSLKNSRKCASETALGQMLSTRDNLSLPRTTNNIDGETKSVKSSSGLNRNKSQNNNIDASSMLDINANVIKRHQFDCTNEDLQLSVHTSVV